MRAPLLVLFTLALGVSACADSTAPVVQAPVEAVALVANSASLKDSQQSLASVFGDAGSRLTLSFAPTAESAILRKSLLAAAASIRSGDMAAAAVAVTAADKALTAIDPGELDPDAAAIRLALGYARTTAPQLANQKQ